METAKVAKNLGILMTRGRDRDAGSRAAALARDAAARGDRVHVFLMVDAVEWTQDPAFMAIAGEGVRISLCAQNARERRVAEVDGADWASLYVLAQIVAECDEFRAFT